jgi:hypothetical protein
MMKIKPTDKVEVKVKGEAYDRYESPAGFFNKTYKGTWEKVLTKISENHSYGTPVGTDAYGETATCEDVLQYIQECNGDGCDYIFHLEVKKNGKSWWVIDDEPVDEEDIDCD